MSVRADAPEASTEVVNVAEIELYRRRGRIASALCYRDAEGSLDRVECSVAESKITPEAAVVLVAS